MSRATTQKKKRTIALNVCVVYIHMKIHTQVCAVIAEFTESLPAKTQRTRQENGKVKIRLHLSYLYHKAGICMTLLARAGGSAVYTY